MAEHVDLETIKSLREEVNWEDERERRDFLRRLQPLIENWNDQLPNLWSFFRPEEIKRLIADSAKGIILATYYVRVEEFQRFKAFVFAGCNEGNYLEFDEPLRRFVRAYHLYRGFGFPDWLIFEIYVKFDANYFDEKTRLKNFHLACKYASYDVVKKFLELGLDANYLQREGGYSALHLSASCIHDDVARTIELLLRNGANPNVADRMGTTPLHLLCVHANHDNVDAVESFLVVCDDVRQRVHIDARDRDGRTPLHLASELGRKGVIELLLRRGADPNADDAQGTTPLHHIAKLSQSYEDDMAEIFFEVCAEMQRTVRVNAQDNLGNTPLHLIMPWGEKKAFKTLLRRGADPNLANEDERTPLHVICEYDRGDEFAQILFEICDEMQLTVQVNARDKSGKTPLQLAVANLLPNAVDGLFNRGADITNCIFPTSIDTKLRIDSPLNCKMRVASGALAVAEQLEARGYRFSRSDALTIVNYFVKHGLFEKSSSDLEKSLRDDHEFASKAKKAMIVPSLSLYDLIHLRPEEEEKLLAYMDYFVFAAGGIQSYIHPSHYENCYLHLCEKLSRGFFRRWALDPFYELIHKRLSIECCEMVLETLENQDLCNICLAAAGQAS